MVLKPQKKLKHNPSATIIGLTLNKKPTYAKKILQLGARGYVTKTSTHFEIIEAINKVAAGGKYIDKEVMGII